MLYYSSIKLYKGKNNPIGRIGFRKILFNGRKQKSPEILLPPFISISELRLMLNLDYISCFRNAKISITKNQYKWSDSYGRTFQTNNKRNIIISYDISSYLSKLMGYKPIKIDPEPKIPQKIKNHIPIISIVGHKNHGKTTLISNFTGNLYGACSHSSNTYNVKNNNYIINSYNIIEEKLKYIILDTPGDMNYDIIRGRAIYNSDICIIVISSQGPEIITRNVILQADKFKIPILFCITKTDLYFNLEILKSELQLQCEILYQSGHLSNNYFNEINNLILSNNLKFVLNKFVKLRYGAWSTATNSTNSNPLTSTEVTTTIGASTVTEGNTTTTGKGANFTAMECTPGKGANSMGMECTPGKGANSMGMECTIKEAPFGASTEDTSLVGPDTVTEKYKKYIRRSNSLIKSGNGIKGIGNIIEITKTESKGIIINLLVKFGQIVEGNYFIVGTTYGKINSIYNNTNEKMNMVGVGELVSITGLKSLDGVGLDDTLLIMSQHDAFRLSQYRKQLEILKSSQIQGPPIHSFNIQYGAGVDQREVGVDEGIEYISNYSGKGMVVEGGNGVNNEEVDEETPFGAGCRDTDTVTENKINKFENIESTIYLKPLEYDTSDTVLGPTESTNEGPVVSGTNSTTKDTTVPNTVTTGKGANSMGMECTSEKNSNEIAVVTKTGESSTFVDSKGVGGTEEVPFGGTVGASTVTVPVTGKKIIPIILRVNYMSILEIILNGIEEIEKEYNVRIPLIHGGIGPIIPIDIVQAQIGNKFTYCPVYSFQVPIHNDAIKHAIINKIVIKSFNIQSDLFNDIIQRCKSTLHKYNNSIS